MEKEVFIKSPLNYTGNKYRIFNQIIPLFPRQMNCMVDLFCGGATVGLNTDAKKVIFIDSNKHIIDLLIFLANSNFDSIINIFESIIEKYNLSFSYKYGLLFW